jgi:hypothetical protein
MLDEADLVSGAALSLAPPAAPIDIPNFEETFALDADMEAFIAPIRNMRLPREKMRRSRAPRKTRFVIGRATAYRSPCCS